MCRGVRNYNDEGGLCEVVGVLNSLLRNHKNLEGVRLLVRPSAIMSEALMCWGTISLVL